MRRQFGVPGLWLQRACRVEETGGLGMFDRGQDIAPKSVGHSQTLPEPSAREEYIKAWIYLLAEMVAARLRRKRLQGRTVFFYMADGFEGGYARRRTFYEPTYDGREIYHRCLNIIQSLRLEHWSARVLGVSVSHLSPGNDLYLFDAQKRRERLMRSLDSINGKFGAWTIYPALCRRGN